MPIKEKFYGYFDLEEMPVADLKGSLVYVRTTSTHVVYLHSWETGYQELMFASAVAAQNWADAQGLRYLGKGDVGRLT